MVKINFFSEFFQVIFFNFVFDFIMDLILEIVDFNCFLDIINDSIVVEIVIFLIALGNIIYMIILNLSGSNFIISIIFIVHSIFKSQSSDRSSSIFFRHDILEHLVTKLIINLRHFHVIILEIIKADHTIVLWEIKIWSFINKFLNLAVTIFILVIKTISIEIGVFVWLLYICKLLIFRRSLFWFGFMVFSFILLNWSN